VMKLLKSVPAGLTSGWVIVYRELACFLIVKESQQKVMLKPVAWSADLKSDSVDISGT
jgi:hypothetical protein